jgi:hypothetical protein
MKYAYLFELIVTKYFLFFIDSYEHQLKSSFLMIHNLEFVD